MERNMLSRKPVAAVLRVIICLPPTLTLYIYIYVYKLHIYKWWHLTTSKIMQVSPRVLRSFVPLLRQDCTWITHEKNYWWYYLYTGRGLERLDRTCWQTIRWHLTTSKVSQVSPHVLRSFIPLLPQYCTWNTHGKNNWPYDLYIYRDLLRTLVINDGSKIEKKLKVRWNKQTTKWDT